MPSTAPTNQPAPQNRKRPAPTTEIEESALGSLVVGILSKASTPAAKIAKTTTGAKKVTAKVTQAPVRQAAPAPKTISPPKPNPQATRKIATPRPVRRYIPTHTKPTGNKPEIKKKYNDDNVDIMKFPPNITIIPINKFEKVALAKIAANPKYYPHITIVGKDERGWTIVRRRNIDDEKLKKFRKEEAKRQRQRELDALPPPKSTRKSRIERARQKLVEEEERILLVQKEAEEASARARAEKEARRKEKQMEEKKEREMRMVALRAMRNA